MERLKTALNQLDRQTPHRDCACGIAHPLMMGLITSCQHEPTHPPKYPANPHCRAQAPKSRWKNKLLCHVEIAGRMGTAGSHMIEQRPGHRAYRPGRTAQHRSPPVAEEEIKLSNFET